MAGDPTWVWCSCRIGQGGRRSCIQGETDTFHSLATWTLPNNFLFWLFGTIASTRNLGSTDAPDSTLIHTPLFPVYKQLSEPQNRHPLLNSSASIYTLGKSHSDSSIYGNFALTRPPLRHCDTDRFNLNNVFRLRSHSYVLSALFFLSLTNTSSSPSPLSQRIPRPLPIPSNYYPALLLDSYTPPSPHSIAPPARPPVHSPRQLLPPRLPLRPNHPHDRQSRPYGWGYCSTGG